MGIMAVGAAHPPLIHPRLKKRAVDINLVQDLPVGVIETIAQEREAVGVVKGRARQRIAVAERFAAGMATGTLLNLRLGLAAREGKDQTQRIGAGPLGSGEIRGVAGPGYMGLAGAVAAFAADPGFGLAAGVGPAFGVIVFFETGGVALRAARVPVLVRAGPMQPIAGWKIEIRVKVIPAPISGIPSDVERLLASASGLDEVLLQRGDTGRPDHFEVTGRAVLPLGADVK